MLNRSGTGDRHRVRYTDLDGHEKSQSFPDKQMELARDFKTKAENDLMEKPTARRTRARSTLSWATSTSTASMSTYFETGSNG
ncbi:hypothetical protein GCM10010452_70720 [Crossiella cryophila]